ncbi:MAG: histidine kinase [Flavobacteriaceae bacterium]|nr:histidine kinase [Flavobacteriaceae bacterium]|tara:strand:- start:153516 stop:153833 length:318 start_codon:yes stop_codon:yes gene_type:complete
MEQPNSSYLDAFAKGDEAFKKQLLDILRTELVEDIDLYFENLNKKDYPQAKLYVHRIKHKMGMLGLEKSYALANKYEIGLLESDLNQQQYFESMLPIMTEYLNSN